MYESESSTAFQGKDELIGMLLQKEKEEKEVLKDDVCPSSSLSSHEAPQETVLWWLPVRSYMSTQTWKEEANPSLLAHCMIH